MLNRVHRQITLEAGDGIPDVAQFIKKENVEATFVTDLSKIDTSIPGTYPIQIQIEKRIYNSKLIIVDTIPPTGQPVNQKIPYGETLEAEAFVENIVDATEVKVSFVEEPDFAVIGDQKVTVVLEDAGNNKVELEAILTIARVKDEVTIEIGTSALHIDDFMMSKDIKGKFVTDVSSIDLKSLGEHEIIVESGGVEYKSLLKIVDTTPPKGDPVDQEAWVNDELEPESFVENIVDHTDVKISYKVEPDFSKEGDQEVLILLEDAGGNVTELKANLTLVADTEPPVIKGDSERLVYIGEKVSYRKYITVTDNRDEEVELKIDSSAVNLKREGKYDVIYTATDSSGNTATKVVTYIVKEMPIDYVSEEEAEALADAVLDKIIKEGMTPREKARAIYDWIRSNVRYSSSENKTDWIKAAYDGIKDGKGDCYTFFSTAKMLLTRADIENIDIVKLNGRHYWNMVNLGEGWYHYDTTPRATGGDLFMMTDDELEAYSKRSKNSHVWDRDKYPTTPKE